MYSLITILACQVSSPIDIHTLIYLWTACEVCPPGSRKVPSSPSSATRRLAISEPIQPKVYVFGELLGLLVIKDIQCTWFLRTRPNLTKPLKRAHSCLKFFTGETWRSCITTALLYWVNTLPRYNKGIISLGSVDGNVDTINYSGLGGAAESSYQGISQA